MRRLFLAALLPVVALTGCGGHLKSKSTLQRCTPENYAMQCALRTVPPPPPQPRTAPPGVISGVDFAWGPPSASQMSAHGWRFGASYLSYDHTGKNWTGARVREFHSHGIATVAVWETSANRAGQGCAAGESDAREAFRQAAALGKPFDRPLDFAVDYDARGSEVDAYFRCAHRLYGDRVNVYGSYDVVTYLCSRHIVGHTNWHTYAWSRGLVPSTSCAPLRQYLNDNAVDFDRAYAADYGQWPYSKPQPKPAPPSAKRQELYRLYHVRNDIRARIRALRRTLAQYHCYPPAHPTSSNCRRWKVEGKRKHIEGRIVNHRIQKLKEELHV